MTAARKKKLERLELRLSGEDKSKIQRAVTFLKMSTTQFVLDKIMPEVEQTLAKEEKIRLNDASWNGFVAMLQSPKSASKSLKSAMKEYREIQGV
jgi:uncharacterized protein (DUF1778 family)